MAYIFASDPNALAGQKNYYDQMNVNLAVRDQEARQRAIDTAQQQQVNANAANQAAQQQAYQFAQQQRAAEADTAYNRGVQSYQFGQQGKNEQERIREFNVGTDLQQQQIGAQKQAALYGEALQAVDAGDITTPDDIEKNYSTLAPDQKQRLNAYLTASTQRKGDQYQQALSAAAAATGAVVGSGTPAAPAVPGAHFGNSATPAKPAVPAPTLTEDQAMAKLAGLKGFTKVMPLLSFDADEQKFVPNMKAPTPPSALTAPPPAPSTALSNYAFGPTQTNAGPANPTMPPVPAPVAPQAGGIVAPTQTNAPRFQFGGNTNAPPQTNGVTLRPGNAGQFSPFHSVPVPGVNNQQKVVTREIGMQLLQRTGGDPVKARQLAQQMGYIWPTW